MKKVLIVVHDFPGSGGNRFAKFVRHFPGLGYDPYVLTVKGWKGGMDAEATGATNGVKVYRTACLRKTPFRVFSRFFGSWSTTVYLESLFFIPDLFITWLPSALFEAIRLVREEKIPIVITTSPPESAHLIGLFLKRFTDIKWVADFQDLWTTKEIVYRPPSPLHDRIVKRLERTVYARCDHVIANTHGNELIYRDLFHIPKDKITVIPNGYDETERTFLVESRKGAMAGDFSVGYMGYFDKNGFPWKKFLLAMKKALKDSREKDVRLHVAGHVSKEARAFIEQQGLSDLVVLHGTLSHNEAFRLTGRCDLLLLLMFQTPYSKAIVPHKLYYYLAMSRPIIAIVENGGEAAEIIRKTKSGQAFPVERTDEAVQAIMNALLEKRRTGSISHSPDRTAIGSYEYGRLAGVFATAMDHLHHKTLARDTRKTAPLQSLDRTPPTIPH